MSMTRLAIRKKMKENVINMREVISNLADQYIAHRDNIAQIHVISMMVEIRVSCLDNALSI